MNEEIKFLVATIRDLEHHIEVIRKRIKKLEKLNSPQPGGAVST